MTATFLQIPFPVFFDSNGDPLDNGYIYIGRPNENPVTDPIEVYFDADLSVPAPQPLRTIRGRINQGGSPGNIYANLALPSAYSMTVLNKNEELVFSVPQGTGFNSALGNLDVTDNTITTVNENGDIILDPSGTGEVVIQSDLGIGTDDPTFSTGSGIEVERAGPSTLRLENSATTKAAELHVDTNVVLAGVSTDQNLILQTNNADRLTITNTGAATFSGSLTGDEGFSTDTGNITTNSGNITTTSGNISATSGNVTTSGLTVSGASSFSGDLTLLANASCTGSISIAGSVSGQSIRANNLLGAAFVSISNTSIEAGRLTGILGGGLIFGTNSSATQRMRLTNDGSLEVNGSSAALTVAGLSNSLFMYYEPNNHRGIIGSFSNTAPSSLSFRTSAINTLPAERLNISSTGFFQLNGGTATFNKFLDNDTLSESDPQAIASQQSIKAYVDNTRLEIPTGTLWDFAGGSSTVPDGWLVCDGRTISRTTYAALFAVIGTNFNTGGEATTVFRIPDFRGRVAAGVDDATANRLNTAYFGNDATVVGNAGGLDHHVLTGGEMPPHTHEQVVQGRGSGASEIVHEPGGGGNQLSFATTSTGSNQGHNNVQPTLIVNKIIKT